MKSNPYKSPETQTIATGRARAASTYQEATNAPLYWLLAIAALTLLLAWIDAIQEGVPGVAFILQVTFGAVVPQLPGLVVGELHRKSNSRTSFTFLMPAFFVSALSLLIYIMYVLAGRVQTVDNAGQMHVIFIPILLAMLAFAAYLATGVVAGIIGLLKRNA